jgi:hypothetical protein
MIPNADMTVLYDITHKHPDGSVHVMEPVHHDAAEHDPERAWLRGQRFRCSDCDATVTLIPNEET